ncbi:MAG: pyridoxal phosphate-dependent aminotransferase [Candidatus Eisenbacteria bacterium]|uniref:Aminotransferase n=1 Tax=Eiseniibacteriota bacterium TaxID=2212470 RepID=A0A956SCI0_UNCEI|nr:pyridoxal phosphate-dependent aminotransferase [Candidatus Eisenbacteria bacterium]MCB9462683.1 pyridoxal phosphate-dependent aminotransferase [Candidatus Eisenbacteria bacterium]
MKPVKVSTRGATSPASPIRKLVPLAVKAKESGKTVHMLNIGQPDLTTPQPMWDAVLKNPPAVLAYSPSEGFPELRRAMARYYEKLDIRIGADQIIITTGASEALVFAVASIADPGDEILIPEPLYANYIGFSHMLGVKVVPIPTRPEDGYHLPPREVWEEKISPRTRAAIVCNPGNPTGTVYRPDELEMVLGIAKDHGLFVVADEVYREFCFDGERHRSFMNYRDTEDRVILIDSISKRFSACGARIGAVSTTNREAYEACHHFSQARLSPPTLGQLMAVDAFAFDDDYYAELAGAYVKRRDAVMEELSKMPGVLCEVPKGAFYAMAKLPVDDSDTFAAWMLSDFSHEGETTFVAPGGGFYATPGAGKQEVRIAYVFEADVMRRAMEVLGKGLEAYPGRIG